MANTNVFRGSDATLTLAVDTGPEGDAAQELITLYQLSPVGRATNVDVYVNTALELFHEIGKRHPAALRPGNIEVSGKIGRAFINGALLRLLLGKGALTARENEPYPQPSFNIQLDLKDPAAPPRKGPPPRAEDGAVSATVLQHPARPERPSRAQHEHYDDHSRREVRELVLQSAGGRLRDGVSHLQGAVHHGRRRGRVKRDAADSRRTPGRRRAHTRGRGHARTARWRHGRCARYVAPVDGARPATHRQGRPRRREFVGDPDDPARPRRAAAED